MNDVDRIRKYFGSSTWRASPARRQIADERRALLAGVARSLSKTFDELSVCDVGCGDGADLRAWVDAGVREDHLAGTELVGSRSAIAQQTVPDADIRTVDDFDLPFPAKEFDICTASLVLSSIPNATDRWHLLEEMVRVTRPGGLVAVYDFTIRKPWNRNVRPISTKQLAAHWRRPDSVRQAAPFLPALELLSKLPPWMQAALTRALPRTHRLWVWRMR